MAEIDTYNRYLTKENHHKVKVREWMKDIKSKMEKIVKKSDELKKIYKKTLDRSTLFYVYCKMITDIISKRCFKQIKK